MKRLDPEDDVTLARAIHVLAVVLWIGGVGLWTRFATPAFWWMHAMVGLWLLFSLMLFIAEPLFLHRWFLARAGSALQATFRLIQGLHWFLLFLSLVTILGAVAGGHGVLVFPWR